MGLIELAALFWAASKKLWIQEEVSQIPEDWSPPSVHGLEGASVALHKLGSAPSPTELYRTLVSVLGVIESEIDPAKAPPVTVVSLEKWQPDPPLLAGTVQVWFREPSLLRRVRSKCRSRADEIETRKGADLPKAADLSDLSDADRAMRYRLEPDNHLRSLTFLLLTFDRPKAKLLPQENDRGNPLWDPLLRSSAINAESSLRIALCPLRGPWFPQFDIEEENEEARFVARPRIFEQHAGALDQHLDQILEEVADQSVRILVLPELSIDPTVRARLRKKLRERRNGRLLAVLGGTFHIGEALGSYRNEAVVWDSRGEPLWKQNKQGVFRLEPKGVREGRRFFPDLKRYPKTSVVEGIQRGGELMVVDTNLGRMAILICADALEPAGYKEIIHRVRPDLVFILAMTPKTSEFDKERAWLARQDIGVLFVNAACVCQKRLRDELVFIDLGFHEAPGGPPTRWRWPIGCGLEWYRYHAPKEVRAETSQQRGGDEAQKDKDIEGSNFAATKENPWRPLSELVGRGERIPVQLMASGAGLILDLESYLREG